MKLVKLFATGILLMLSSALYATDFSGIWVGTATKSGEALHSIAIELVSRGGDRYEGKCAMGATHNGTDYRIGTAVKGDASGSRIVITDESVINSTQPSGMTYFWCVKSLSLSKNGNELTGTISGTSPGGECVTVSVSLQKK